MKNATRKLSLLFAVLFLSGGMAMSQTLLSGTISKDSTLTSAKSPYQITSSLTINDGFVLTIDPGVLVYGGSITVNGTLTIGAGAILKFDNNRILTLNVTGTLNVNGVNGNPVYMTSNKDDNWGGDTNADGATTAPASGNWYGIHSTSNNMSIDYLEIRYAGLSGGGAINFLGVNGTLSNSSISNSYYGVKLTGNAAPTITGTSFGSADLTPIAMAFTANPTMSGNTLSFSENQYDAIGLLGETMTANRTISVRGFGSITNLTYMMLEDLIVPENLTLTIEPGVVIKSVGNKRIEVQGTLVADGGIDSPIVFTSVKDDTYGDPLDTNRDGNITTPGGSDFGGFLMTPTATVVMDSVVVRYAQENESVFIEQQETFIQLIKELMLLSIYWAVQSPSPTHK